MRHLKASCPRCDGIQRELSAQLGRTKRTFHLWQDVAAIAPGKLWESEIKTAIDGAFFFIPIVTPRSVGSKYCKFEFESFLAREKAIGRSDLVFPILYISVAALESEAKWRDDVVLSTIGRRQYVDWRSLRHLDAQTTVVREQIERLCQKIVEALNEPWVPPEERWRMEEAEARQRAEEEVRRLDAETKRRAEEQQRRKQEEAEARQRAEEEAQRLEAEAKRRAAEEQQRKQEEARARQHAEEEARRLEAEAKRRAEEQQYREQEEAKARQRAEEERRRLKALAKRLADEAGEEERRKRAEADAWQTIEQEYERKAPEAPSDRSAKAGRWRLRAAIGAVVLLLVGWPAYVFIQHMKTVEQTVQPRDGALKAGIARQARAPRLPKVDEPQPSSTEQPAAQRVVLYDEDPSDPQGKQYVGSVVWRTEPIKASDNQKPDIAVHADIDIPDCKFKMTMSFRRNTDSSLPASHTAELTFILPPDFANGGVSNVPGILMKSNEQARGTPLAGLAVKVTDGFFVIGLSNVDADRSRNLQLLKERSWFDVPLVYSNQRRAIIAIQKGAPGERAFSDAFAAWGE
jgi:TIR domain